jgi:proliferating cell nuclear antigen
MEFTPKDSVLFRNAVDALSTFLPHASLCFTNEGLKVSGMDVSHVGFVDYFLSKEDCNIYKFTVPFTVGIDTSVLSRTLSSVGSNDSVTVKIPKDSDNLTIEYTNTKVGKKAVYKIHLMTIDEESLDLPEISYAATVITKTSDIVGIVKEVSTFGDSIGFSLDENGFHVNCKGDIGSVTQTLENTDERTMELDSDQSINACYGGKYVQNIVRGGSSLANTIRLEFDNTQPLRTSFHFGTGSRFVSYLAPKMMDDT